MSTSILLNWWKPAEYIYSVGERNKITQNGDSYSCTILLYEQRQRTRKGKMCHVFFVSLNSSSLVSCRALGSSDWPETSQGIMYVQHKARYICQWCWIANGRELQEKLSSSLAQKIRRCLFFQEKKWNNWSMTRKQAGVRSFDFKPLLPFCSGLPTTSRHQLILLSWVLLNPAQCATKVCVFHDRRC